MNQHDFERRRHWHAQLVVTDLRYESQAKKLFVATFGMGVCSIKV
ncbi:MAG: hypothetical protein ABJA81_11855 [Nocardioidaceae bacterium]